MLLLYQFRFLDTPTIQLYLKHKLPTRIQQWLKDLVDKGYIVQFYDKASFINRTKPAIYCLSSKAAKILKSQKDCEAYILSQLYREKQRSQRFQIHCCDIAKIAYSLKQYYKEQDKDVSFFSKIELTSYVDLPQPPADGYFSVTKQGTKTKYYFLELFDEKIPKRFIKSKIRRYFTCADTWDEDVMKIAFPTLLLVTQTSYEQKKVMRCARTVLREEWGEVSIYVTTKDTLIGTKHTWGNWMKIVDE